MTLYYFYRLIVFPFYLCELKFQLSLDSYARAELPIMSVENGFWI